MDLTLESFMKIIYALLLTLMGFVGGMALYLAPDHVVYTLQLAAGQVLTFGRYQFILFFILVWILLSRKK